jgi:hypothetical protein
VGSVGKGCREIRRDRGGYGFGLMGNGNGKISQLGSEARQRKLEKETKKI